MGTVGAIAPLHGPAEVDRREIKKPHHGDEGESQCDAGSFLDVMQGGTLPMAKTRVVYPGFSGVSMPPNMGRASKKPVSK